MPRRTGVLLLSLALGWVVLAVNLGGAAWALLWAALSFGLAALGYLGLGARVFGKREDGSLRWFQALLAAPYLFFGWCAWQAVRLGPEETWNRIAPWLYLGRRPAAGELPPEVTAVVDLTAEFPVDRRLLGERSYLCLPTLDAHVPAPEALASLVDRALERGGVLYVHCAYGHGRSALVAAAMLLRRGEASTPQEAVARLKAARPRVKLSPSQRAALERFTPQAQDAPVPPG